MAQALQKILRDEQRAPVLLMELAVGVLCLGLVIGLGLVAYLR